MNLDTIISDYMCVKTACDRWALGCSPENDCLYDQASRL